MAPDGAVAESYPDGRASGGSMPGGVRRSKDGPSLVAAAAVSEGPATHLVTMTSGGGGPGG